jgi:hydrogenase/urease accessory protein HupE
MIRSFFLIFIMPLLVLLPQFLLAHDARPVVVTITEQLPGVFQFVVRVPETVEGNNQPEVVWPQGCSIQNAVSAIASSSGSIRCTNSLKGQSLSLEYPFYNPSLATFYRLTNFEGESMTSMLSPTQSQWIVPQEPSRSNVAIEYLTLGMEHIIGGLDHLLFVLGLLVIARTLKRILWTVTGFTLAHSISLSLSALGFVTIPIVPVEAVIALSIVYLAFEISRKNHDSLTYRYPLLVSFGFGLLHGLGFASALGEIGLVQNEILLSLLFFNLGVEMGQLAFILAVVAAYWCLCQILLKVVSKNARLEDVWSSQGLDLPAAYLIGIPASYWLIDRIVQFL